MPSYRCKVGAQDGTVLERVLVAESESSARRQLRADGFAVFGVEPKSGTGTRIFRRMFPWSRRGSDESDDSGASDGAFAGLRSRRVREVDLLHLTQELAALVGAGLPILQSLDILRPRRSGTLVGDILERVRERVARGAGLSGGFAPEVEACGVPSLFVTTLEIGEASGDLESALRRYGAHLERSQDLKGRLQGALFYPAALLLVALVVVGILLGLVIPRFGEFYSGYDAELPVATQALISVSAFLRSYPMLVLVVLGVPVLLWLVLRRTERGRRLAHELSLRTPLLGNLQRQYLDVETCRTVSTLLRGGSTLVQALEVTGRGTDNVVYRRRLRAAQTRLREGSTLWRAFEEQRILDDLGLEMVQVGESTGSLEDMLEHVGRMYDEQLTRRLDNLVGLVEPALLIVMGLLVAGILLALYMPLFNVVQVV